MTLEPVTRQPLCQLWRFADGLVKDLKMERKSRFSVHNPLCSERESKFLVQTKLKKRRERDESRREIRRLKSEEVRQKNLEERTKKTEESSTYFTKDGERERRAWILGVGNISSSPTQESSPKIDPKRRQYNRAMRKLAESRGWKSTCSEESANSTPEPKNNRIPVPHANHEDVYHSSQFQVSELIPPPKPDDAVICRICQSDEDSLRNQLVTPCGCLGSLRFVHHLCLQQWRRTKKASGADITKCELCLRKYDAELLGSTDVKPDQTRKMQEDLRRLVRSGVYLMLLVDFCREGFQSLLEEREASRNQRSTVPVEVHPSQSTALSRPHCNTLSTAHQAEGIESSDDNDEYVSRAQLKNRSEQHRRIR